jgi:hypothetical protein
VVLDKNVAQGWRDPRELCPVDAQEALETDRAIRRLPPELNEIITIEHFVVGKQARKLEVLAMSRTTYWRRCNEAYGLLLGLMNDVAAGL